MSTYSARPQLISALGRLTWSRRGRQQRSRASLRAAATNSGIGLLPVSAEEPREQEQTCRGCGHGAHGRAGSCSPLGQRTFPKSSSNSGDHSCMRVSMSGMGLPGKKRSINFGITRN